MGLQYASREYEGGYDNVEEGAKIDNQEEVKVTQILLPNTL